MKLKVEFDELKKAVIAVGKAVKKSPLITPLIKMEAANGHLMLSVNGTIDASVKIQADVSEEGSFLTTFSSINILSIRKVNGEVNISSPNENSLLLKYKNGLASTVLTQVSEVFNNMPVPQDGAQRVSVPLSSLKEMVRETIFVTEDNIASALHSVKLDVEDDEDGILKFVMTACDGRSLAVRTAYTAKNGDYTGDTLILPENLKTAISLIDDNDGNVEIIMDGDKLYMFYDNTKVCLRTVSNKNFPDMSGLLNNRKCDFFVKTSKAEFIEALNCAAYLQAEAKTLQGFESSVAIGFDENKISIGCVNLSSYQEHIDAETTGELPGTMFFNIALLKEIVSTYPSDMLEFGGTNVKSPIWLCCGENDEYIYCVLPRSRRNNS